MKKQILILALFVMAIFAGVNNSYGQTPGPAVIGQAPRGTSCTDDALHPLAGKEYTYTAASNQAGNYTFWATKASDFISSTGTAPTQVTTNNMAGRLTTPAGLLVATNYATAAATDNTKLTWSDATLAGTTVAAPTFVVALQDGLCANNLKVWSITPTVAFTVDVRNINHTGLANLAYDAAESQCMDQVRGAAYNAGATRIDYDYGTQYLYWEVIAANFTNSWTPTFQISGLGNGQTATIEWDVLKTFVPATTTTPVAIVNATPVVSATAVTTAATNTSTGVSIYVKVTVTNHTYEGINSTPITLAVDGQNSVSTWDIVNGAGVTCTPAAAADQADTALQTLNPRPTVTSTTVGVAPNANPGLYVPVNSTN